MAIRHLKNLFQLRTLLYQCYEQRLPVTVKWHRSAVEVSLDLRDGQVARGVSAMVVQTEIELIEALFEALSIAKALADKEALNDG